MKTKLMDDYNEHFQTNHEWDYNQALAAGDFKKAAWVIRQMIAWLGQYNDHDVLVSDTVAPVTVGMHIANLDRTADKWMQ